MLMERHAGVAINRIMAFSAQVFKYYAMPALLTFR